MPLDAFFEVLSGNLSGADAHVRAGPPLVHLSDLHEKVLGAGHQLLMITSFIGIFKNSPALSFVLILIAFLLSRIAMHPTCQAAARPVGTRAFDVAC
jgi:hypothetical protein